jgi:hypothetical protein
MGTIGPFPEGDLPDGLRTVISHLFYLGPSRTGSYCFEFKISAFFVSHVVRYDPKTHKALSDIQKYASSLQGDKLLATRPTLYSSEAISNTPNSVQF